ncbi:MAG: virulence RhuM family protein, partial [Planctomycetes bacterium]|nr:virulence RhuM family protein [Planctomycetota bacterium]
EWINEENRIVAMWQDFAEDQARRRRQVWLRDWRTRLDEFLRFNERAVLPGKGRVSRADADARAETEYERFATRRRALLQAEAERAQQTAPAETKP